MKLHRTTYFRKSTACNECYEVVMIRRNPKPKSLMRTIMWKAWWYDYIESYNKKHKIDETA